MYPWLLRSDVNDDFVKTGHARFERPVFVPFLHFAFTVSSANYDRVIAWLVRHPSSVRVPERPREIAASVVNICVSPDFSIVETKLDARDAAIAAKGDA